MERAFRQNDTLVEIHLRIKNMNYYNVRIWQTYLDYSGVLYIVTEVDKKWVVLVDEEGEVLKVDRLRFIREVMGARFNRVLSTEWKLHVELS